MKKLVLEVLENSRPLDRTTEYLFRTIPALSFSEKERLHQVFTFVIRHWLLIGEIHKKLSGSRPDFERILSIQNILARHFHEKPAGNGKYEKAVIGAYKELSENRHLKESFPLWLDSLCYAELGTGWEKMAAALNRTPAPVLRVNTLKCALSELQGRLISSGGEVSPLESYPEALVVNKYFNVFQCSEFQAGMFEMQDAGSQAIAPFLNAEPGMRVVDACAGNGGKTLHLSGLMKNRGKIIALDIAPHKLEVLKKRMKRAGSFNIETRPIDSMKVIKRLHHSADRLLLDVPCSGTGVLKRNPDIKYHLSPVKLQNLLKTQEEILEKYSPVVTKGGYMVYSTCSILPSENKEQVHRFLEKNQGSFELVDERLVSPLDGFDGFYMAGMKRVN